MAKKQQMRLVRKDGRRTSPIDDPEYAAWVVDKARKIRPEDYTADPNTVKGERYAPAMWESYVLGTFVDGRDGTVHRISSLIRYPEGIIFDAPRKKGAGGEYRTVIDPFVRAPILWGRKMFISWLDTASQHLTPAARSAAEALIEIRRWTMLHAMFAVDIVADAYRPFYESDESES